MQGRRWIQITDRTWALQDEDQGPYARHIARLKFLGFRVRYTVTGPGYDVSEHPSLAAMAAAELSLDWPR